MIEMDPTEYSLSTVEDSELIAILSLYEELSAIEAISIKDLLLYKGDENGRPIGINPSNVGIRSVLGIGHRNNSGVYQDQGWAPQKKAE